MQSFTALIIALLVIIALEAMCPPCEAVHPLKGDTNLYSFDYLHKISKTAKKRRLNVFNPYGYSRRLAGLSRELTGFSREPAGFSRGLAGFSRRVAGLSREPVGCSREGAGLNRGLAGLSRKLRFLMFPSFNRYRTAVFTLPLLDFQGLCLPA
jgi:hypothetical protein